MNGQAEEDVDPREIPPARPFHAMRWYVLSTDSHRERAVVEWLRKRGHEAVAPVVHVKRRRWADRSRRRTLFTVPLMPRYVVAGFEAAPAWLDIFGLRVIRGVVGMDGSPAPVPPVQVAALAARIGAAPIRPGRAVSVDDRAQLLDGPLCYHWVTVERVEGDLAHWVTDLFGGTVRGSSPLDILVAA